MKTQEAIIALQQNSELKAIRIWDKIIVSLKDGQLIDIKNDGLVNVGHDDNWVVFKEMKQVDFMTAHKAWHIDRKSIAVASSDTGIRRILTPMDISLLIENSFINNGIWYILEV